MKKLLLTAAPVLMFGLIASAANAQYGNQQGYPQQQQGYPQQQPMQQGGQWEHMDRPDWDAPPAEFNNDIMRRAFHDGIDGARMDFQTNRPHTFADDRNYRRPPVPRPMRDAYRQSYARGYETAQHRMEWMRAHQENDWHHDHDNWRNQYPH